MSTAEPAATERHAVFDIHAIAAKFPSSAATMLVDTRLTDEAAASSRIVRIYRPVPAHYHATCDEYLFVLSGRASFFIDDANAPFEVGPGRLLFFRKSIVHGIPAIHEHPFALLTVDTPRRDPKDVHFLDPADGTPETFIASRRY